MKLYHGGIAGLKLGDVLRPSPPHVTDGCPICVARALGVALTVGEYRAWLRGLTDKAGASRVLAMLEGASDDDLMDPPREDQDAVYVTSDLEYARWYAARSHGDLYRVRPCSEPRPSSEDPFPTWKVASAEVVEVVERRSRLTRQDRRRLMRRWGKADRADCKPYGGR